MGNIGSHLPANLNPTTNGGAMSPTDHSITRPTGSKPSAPTQIRETGTDLATLIDEPLLSDRVFAEGMVRVGQNFGINSAGRDPETGRWTNDAEKARLLQAQLRTLGWTDGDFLTALQDFLLRCEFRTWTIAEFLKSARPKVYPYSWYLEQVREGKDDQVGRYRAPGIEKPVFGWKHEVGDRLPVFTPAVVAKELPAPVEPIKPETTTAIAEAKLKIAEGMNADYEKTLTRTQQENAHLRSRNQMLELELKEARQLLELERNQSAMLQEEIERLTSDDAPEAACQ
jgi:hypothetical protein